jgi:hypothetical protein
MVQSLGFGTSEQFFSEEYISLDLNDKRLNDRAKGIFLKLQSKLGSCIRRLFIDQNEARQAYDFFSNPKVSREKLVQPHYKRTKERINSTESKYILAIQDQTRLNFTSHRSKIDLGRISKANSADQYGLIQHSTLCVTDKNEPLGLIDVEFFHYDEFNTKIHPRYRPIEEKASCHWINASNRLRQRLGDINKRIITVADREGDFYEFLQPLIQNKDEFVIRATHDRYTGEKNRSRGEKIWDLLKQAPAIGTMETTIQDVNSREIKTIKLNLKAITATIPSPKKGSSDFVKINIVQTYNEDQEWVLLTNLPIDTLEQIKEIVEIYKNRWHIEDYHKVLKTGYQVDEIYLHSSRDAIENLLIMASISACRLYWLIYTGRSEEGIKANQIFEEFEWKTMYVVFDEKIPDECPAISEIILRIARLGGYKPGSKSPPGVKTLWIGYQQFTIAAQVYRNMSRKT